MKKKFFTAFLLFGLLNANIYALKIVAFVDNAPITDFDLNVQKKIFYFVNQIENTTKEQESELERVSLETLIDSKLLIAHSIKSNALPKDQHINFAIENVARSRSMTKDKLILELNKKGISENELKHYIAYEIIKSNILSSLNSEVSVSKNEVDSTIISYNAKDLYISSYLFISFDKSEKSLNKMKNLAKSKIQCDNFQKYQYKNFAEAKPLNSKISYLNYSLQNIAKYLYPKEKSNVFEYSDDSYGVLMMCSKYVIDLDNKEAAYLSNMLFQHKLNIEFKKFMDDLRKVSYIQILKKY